MRITITLLVISVIMFGVSCQRQQVDIRSEIIQDLGGISKQYKDNSNSDEITEKYVFFLITELTKILFRHQAEGKLQNLILSHPELFLPNPQSDTANQDTILVRINKHIDGLLQKYEQEYRDDKRVGKNAFLAILNGIKGVYVSGRQEEFASHLARMVDKMFPQEQQKFLKV